MAGATTVALGMLGVVRDRCGVGGAAPVPALGGERADHRGDSLSGTSGKRDDNCETRPLEGGEVGEFGPEVLTVAALARETQASSGVCDRPPAVFADGDAPTSPLYSLT